jgi:hypothetical protein
MAKETTDRDRERRDHIKKVQEWLCLHGFGVVIDGAFGPATQLALKRFQRRQGLNGTGIDDAPTVAALTKPIRDAEMLRLPVSSMTYSKAVAFCAATHLREHPREVGGQNRGPWVRLYMDDVEGQPWCAGFVSYIIRQAAELLGLPKPPIAGSVSCAELAVRAHDSKLFVSQHAQRRDIPPGSIMLVEGGPHGYNHCGIVISSNAETFETIEGNTNSDGGREGWELAKRIRSYSGKDFICWKD